LLFAHDPTTQPLNPYQLQLDITGFLHKDAALFVAELWTLLLSAQNAPRGMPPELVAAAKEKILRERQAKAEQDELVRKRLQEHASKMKQNQVRVCVRVSRCDLRVCCAVLVSLI